VPRCPHDGQVLFSHGADRGHRISHRNANPPTTRRPGKFGDVLVRSRTTYRDDRQPGLKPNSDKWLRHAANVLATP
jgi:hypothetical protein